MGSEPTASATTHPTASVATGVSVQSGQGQAKQFVLPTLVFGLPEIRRLVREMEALDEYMREAAVREAGKQAALPRMSRLCEALAAENRLNLLQPQDRQQLKAFLVDVEQTAPQVHISFASDPSSAFTSKVVTWLRGSLHPHTLMQVGLQPNLAAGCVVRTDNKVFDFSLREHFVKTQGLLLEAFDAMATTPAPAPIPATAVTPSPTPAQTPAPVTVAAAPVPTPAPIAGPALQAVPLHQTAPTPVMDIHPPMSHVEARHV